MPPLVALLPVLAATPFTAVALLLVAGVVALVAWALQLMQSAIERQEFALMLAGCMVCSAAVGLAAVMVLTFTGPERLEARGLVTSSAAEEALVPLDALTLRWEAESGRAAGRL